METASEVGLNGKLIICDSVLILGAILIIHGLRGVLMVSLGEFEMSFWVSFWGEFGVRLR